MDLDQLEHEWSPLTEGGAVVVPRRLTIVRAMDVHMRAHKERADAGLLSPLVAGRLEVGNDVGDLHEFAGERRDSGDGRVAHVTPRWPGKLLYPETSCVVWLSRRTAYSPRREQQWPRSTTTRSRGWSTR